MEVKTCLGICAFCRFNCRGEEGGVVVSAIEGRIRLRNGMLENPVTAIELESRLGSNPAVRSVSWNRRTGSLLIVYEAASANQAGILSLVSSYLDVKKRAKRGCGRAQSSVGRLPAPTFYLSKAA